VTISVNGTAVSLAQNGSWTGTAALKQGTNTITVVAADAVGNTVTISRTVTADWTAPVLVISSPLDSTITKLSSMTVSGTIKDSTAVTLTINGNSVPISNGTFTTTVNLAEGTNKITIVATDAAGNTTSISRTVRVDRIAPALVVSSPLDSVITNLSRVTISGTVKDSTAVTLTVNGVNVPINNGSFTTQIVLTEGKNRFTIVATDAAGNTTTVSRTVIADRTPPSLAVSSPIDSTITNLSSIIVSGTISDSTAVTLTVNGQSVSVSNGSFAITIFLTEGINKITIAATDAAGNTSSIIRTVRFAVQPPVLTVQTPVDSQITNLLVINVNGTVTGSSSVSLTVNGNTVPIVNNSFTSKISLTEGINTITFIATDAAGNKTIVSRFVIRDTQAPIVNLKSPIDSLITKLQSIVVSGTVKDSTKIELFVNGNPINVNTNGSFNDTTWLIEGMNLVQVSATDAAGNTTFIVRHVRLDTQPPVITIFSPSDSLITKNTKIVLNGSVTDSTAVIFTINGVAYPIHSDGSFSDTLSVSEGANTFTLVATDFMGNQTTIKRTVSRNTKSPVINLIAPLAGITTIDSVISLTGSINDVSGTTITLNGLQQSPDQNGGFKATMKLIQGSNPISITATDQAGNTSVFNSSVTRVLPVPDPAVVAPKLDTTVATNMGDATAFLYSGPNPIQKGVTPGTIKKMQVCVVRGHVLDKNRNPLKGVNVSVLNHSEFGSTLSRDDGMYDLAVNGGSYLTINYDRIGYLPAQRKVDARWQLYRRADDVVLLQMDTTAHHIDLSAAQIVQGNQVTDSLGSRKPSLFIRPGTTANLIFNKYTCRVLGSCSIGANYWCGTPTTVPSVLIPSLVDSLLPVNAVTVRMTEYTANSNGDIVIPCALPATVGLTFAFELSADEMISSGAKDIRFNQPAVFYLENVMNFPVGLTVPFGRYDRQNGVWNTSANGKVIKIMDTTGGTAAIDYNGDGIADPVDTLVFYGISVIEQQYLAQNYAKGQSLWRCEITHLGTFAAGFTMLGPSDAQQPHNALPDRYTKMAKDNVVAGSVIGVQDQTLSESIPVTNTGMSLNYKSDRVFGRKEAYTLDIPLTGTTLPQGISDITLDVEIVGKKYSYSFSPQANLTYHFVWDGMDAYSRRVQGQQNILTTITYSYPAQYEMPPDYSNCFAVPSGRQIVKYIPTLKAIQMTQTWEGKIGAFDIVSLGIGGWSLNIHHGYDCVGKILYQGDGTVRNAQLMDNVAVNVAGSTQSIPSCPWGGGLDGTVAAQNPIAGCNSMAFDANGQLYYSDSYSVIRKIDTLGVTSSIGGLVGNTYDTYYDTSTTNQANCSGFFTSSLAIGPDNCVYVAEYMKGLIWKITPYGERIRYAGIAWANTYTGDGGPAVQASFYNPSSTTFDKDGNLYVFEGGNHRIRKISPDGIVTTVAGNGVQGWSGDGGPATNAMISGGWQPVGNGSHYDGATNLKIGPDGSIYFSDGYNMDHIRKITPDGIIHTIAGAGGGYPDGDGGLAINAHLCYPVSLALGKDGTIYYASAVAVVRGISTDGYIKTIIGGGSASYWNNGPATGIAIGNYPNIAVGTDDNLYATTGGSIIKATPPLPGISLSEILIASEDGSEQYVFSYGGRHLRTLDALTGVVKYKFNYDSLYHLTSIVDVDSNITTIERDTTGNATAIISPYGVRTDLQLDTLGYLLQATNPAYESNIFTYTTGGLMTSKTDARGNMYNYSYDTLGYLTKDMDPAGGYTNLTRQYDSVGYTVTSLTAMGKKTIYRVDKLHDGSRVLTNTDANGLKTITTIGTDGTSTTTVPNGTNTPDQQTPDPRFGMQSPLQNVTVNTPGGLQSTVNQTRAITQMTGNSVTGLTDNVQVNGKTYTTQWDGNARMLTKTSAEGRKTFSFYDAKGRDVKDSTAGLAPTMYKYDTRGRKVQTIQGPNGAGGRVTTYAYDSLGRQSKVTDPYGHCTQFFYDAGDRLVETILPDSSEISFTYDHNGNMLSVTPPSKPAHGFEYTAVDLEQKYIPPFAGDSVRVTAKSYNYDKEITRIARPDSLNMDFFYGGKGSLAGQPKCISYDRGTMTFLYDTVKGLVTGVISPNGDSLLYQYDGQLPKNVRWTGAINGKINARYNSDLKMLAETVNNKDSITFAYDKDGLLTSAGSLKLKSSATNELLLSDTLGNLVTNYSYNAFGETASQQSLYGSTILYQVSYIRDSLGRIKEKIDSVAGVKIKYDYVYDAKGQLVQVSKNDTMVSTYYYDANGNRIAHTIPAKSDSGFFDAQDRLFSYSSAQDSTTRYIYSANGDLQKKIQGSDTTRYDYDAMGNLLSVVLANGTKIEYVPDGAGRRIVRKVNGQITNRWLYSDELRISAEVDSAGNVISHFVYATKQNVPEYVLKSGIAYRVVTDQLGSVRQVINTTTGQIVQQMDYDEYGNVTIFAGQQIVPMGFAGGLYDQQTGLIKFGARDYDAIIGRWTRKDPTFFASGSTNHYLYANNDPLNKLDGSGTVTSTEAALMVGVSTMSYILSIYDIIEDAESNNYGALSVDLAMHTLSAYSMGASFGILASSLNHQETGLDENAFRAVSRAAGANEQTQTFVAALSHGVSLAVVAHGFSAPTLRSIVWTAELASLAYYSSKFIVSGYQESWSK
jgi:RHS repeat-associated protein